MSPEARLARPSEARRFAAVHPGLTLLDSVETRYGHVAIARFQERYPNVTVKPLFGTPANGWGSRGKIVLQTMP